jgi:hypothetical protein
MTNTMDEVKRSWFKLTDLRAQIAQRRIAEQSVDGRPRVGENDVDPLLAALEREHGDARNK